MSNVHEAEALARWLQSAPGTEPPPGVDPDVVEGILALRPDLAPPHRITVDDVLSALTEGPLADPGAVTAAAQQLHAWLEAHPGQEPPAELDPVVVEAAYALRPDLAPAARVTIDDVMAEITTGPLASHKPITNEPISLDAERTKRAPWWAWSGLGVAAVAATAILFVIPIAHMADISPTSKKSAAVPNTSASSAKRAKKAKKMAKKMERPDAVKVGRQAARKRGAGAAAPQQLSASTTVADKGGQAGADNVRAHRKTLQALEARSESPGIVAPPAVEAAYAPPAPAPVAEVADYENTVSAPASPRSAAEPPSATGKRKRSARGGYMDADDAYMAAESSHAEGAVDEQKEEEMVPARTLEVRMTQDGIASGVELTCFDGYRIRKTLKRNRTLFTQIPQGACTLIFRGGVSARRIVQPGEENLVCSLDGTFFSCKAVSARSR